LTVAQRQPLGRRGRWRDVRLRRCGRRDRGEGARVAPYGARDGMTFCMHSTLGEDTPGPLCMHTVHVFTSRAAVPWMCWKSLCILSMTVHAAPQATAWSRCTIPRSPSPKTVTPGSYPHRRQVPGVRPGSDNGCYVNQTGGYCWPTPF